MKTLVVYGTRYGTASEIAEEISQILKNEGIKVDLKDARKLKNYDITSYDLVIVGSGIKMGKWTNDSIKFLKNNKSKLKDKNVALFVTCGAANVPESRDEGQEKYLDEIAAEYLLNKPIKTGLFGSVYDPHAKGGLLFKMANKFIIKKELEKQGKDPNIPHDYRDWDYIRSWARDLAKLH